MPAKVGTGSLDATADALVIGQTQALRKQTAKLLTGGQMQKYFTPHVGEICPQCGTERRRCGNPALPITIDYARGAAFWEGRGQLHLSTSLLAAFSLFIDRSPGAVRKEELYAYLYGGHPNGGPDAKVLDVFTCKLRIALKRVGWPIRLVTAWGTGWHLELDEVAE